MFCPRCGTWLPDEAASCSLCGLVIRPASAAATTSPVAAAIVEPVAYAGFWRRFWALLIDVIVTYFPIATVRVLLGLPAEGTMDMGQPAVWWSAFFELLICWLYAGCLISSPWRATLGQAVMDLHVTDLKGDRISFARATARYLAQVLNLFTFGFGILMQLFSARRQALHDLVSGTVVVRSRARVVPTPVMRLAP